MAKKSRTRNRPSPAPKVQVAPASPEGPNRKVRKEEARRQREAIQRRMARRRYYRYIAAALVVVVAGAALAYATLGHKTHSKNNRATLPGLNTGPTPWAPENQHLAQRLTAMGLPAVDGGAMHIHQHVVIFIHGKNVPVGEPANSSVQIGLLPPSTANPQGAFAPIHTHDDSGIIHVESPVVRTFTLGNFFGVWGVRFTPTCIGGYCNKGSNELLVYLNGKPYSGNPTLLPLKQHEEIVVTYGTKSELPNPIPSKYSASLSTSCAPSC